MPIAAGSKTHRLLREKHLYVVPSSRHAHVRERITFGIVKIDQALLDVEEIEMNRRIFCLEKQQKVRQRDSFGDAVEVDEIAFAATTRERIELHAGDVFDRSDERPFKGQ